MMSLILFKGKQQPPVPVDGTATVTSPSPALPNADISVKFEIDCKPDEASAQPEEKQTLLSPETLLCSVQIDAIPTSLKNIDNWVHWKLELNNKDKPTKVPYMATSSHKAASTDHLTWSSFETAVNYLDNERGLGFVLPPSGEMFFLDLDHVRNPETGEITPWALRVIETVNSYTEISPSGTGIHILGFVKGIVPPGGLKKGSIESYTQGRYTTITGNHYDGSPLELKEMDISQLYKLIQAGVFNFHDNPKYDGLFNNTGKGWEALGYSSHSEADMALCSLLAQKLGNNLDDIDSAFRLSGMMRTKWDAKLTNSTYGRYTILKIIQQDTSSSYRDTDVGNAERLVARHGKDLRYSHSSDEWNVWDGTRYATDKNGEIERRAIDTVKSTFDEAAKASHKQGCASSAWAKASMSSGHINASIRLARTDPRISITADKLDVDPWLLNCLNGTVDLRMGTLREHRREDLITKRAPVVFDADAKCPQWDKFLWRIMDDNVGLISFLHRAIGYSLTGSTQEGVIFLQHGLGRNGKTVFSETINYLAGDYARTADANLLLTRRSEGPRHDIARLEGARLVWTSETADGVRFDEALVKLLTGGDKITVRRLYHELTEFFYAGKIWLRTNNKPQIIGRDVAIWKRLMLIPFRVTIPDNEQDKELRQKLLTEGPGILASLVRGCLEWQKIGLCPPPEVIAATDEYEKESDALKDFLEDRCIVDKGLTTPCTELYKAYRSYCEENGQTDKHIWDTGYFGKQLGERGFGQKKVKGQRCRTGIGLKPEATPEVLNTLWTGAGNSAVLTESLLDMTDLASKL
jgi:putative DNA primase/helicase